MTAQKGAVAVIPFLSFPSCTTTTSPTLSMSTTLSLLLNGFGALLIFHAAYSCLHFRNIVADLEFSEESIPPLDVVVECIGGFFILLLSQIFVSSGTLVPITSKTKTRSLVAPAYKTRDFDIYSNRAHAMKQ